MRSALGVVLVLVAWAGCIGDGDDDAQRAWTGAIAPAGADGMSPWTLQLCDRGYRVVQSALAPAWRPADRLCDFRVTKPLADGARFDWTTQHGPANEVSLAVNPTDPLNLAGGAKDYTVSYISDVAQCGEFTVWNGHFVSHDGGRTWSNDLVPGFPGDDRDSPLHGNLCNTDPVSVFDSDGTYWHNGLNYRGARDDVGDPITPTGNGGIVTGSQIFFARSPATAKAVDFDRITFGSYGQNDPGIFNDKNWLAVDPGSDHMIHTWTNFYAAGPVIEFIESHDGGATWSHPLPLTAGVDLSGTPIVPSGQFSMPQYLANGDIAVIWSNLLGGVVYTEGVQAVAALPTMFGPPVVAALPPADLHDGAGCLGRTAFRASVYPVLAVDDRSNAFPDRRYIAFPAVGGDGADVWVTWSDDGLDWTDPIAVTAGSADDQFMPWIDVGPDGTVHVAYYDCSAGTRDGDGRLTTVGWMWSDDGGTTWNGPFHIAQVPFDGDLGHHQNGSPFIGDYIAVDASDQAVHFFWADTRHSGVAGEGRPAGSDVYAATVIKDGDDMVRFAPELS